MLILTYLIEKQRLYSMHALIIATADRANAFLPNLPYEKTIKKHVANGSCRSGRLGTIGST